MPLTAAALLAAAGGELEPELFPGESAAAVDARLAGYLTSAYALPSVAAIADLPTRDRAAAAYAYHRAYRAVATRLSMLPASASEDGKGSRSYLASQLQHFADLAADKLAEFEAVAGDTTPSVTAPLPRASRSTANVVTW